MPFSRKELDFVECVDASGITDIPSIGTYYTWSNKRSMGFLAKKLDRVMGNIHWLDTFSDVVAEFFPPNFSDQSARHIRFIPITHKTSSFKFF